MEKIKLKKFKTRSLTKNETFLLSALGLVIFIWSIFNFILTPQAEKIEGLEIQKMEYESKIVENTISLEKEKRIEAELNSLDDERDEILSNYFPKLDQAQIIYLLNDLLEDDTVDISDINFTRPTMESFGEIQANQMSISIPFTGAYDGIMNIIRAMNNSPRRIALDRISMDQNGDLLVGNMDLKIYSLEGIVETDPDIIYIDQESNDDISTPFSPYNEDYSSDDFSYLDEDDEFSTTMDGNFTKEKSGEIIHDFEIDNFDFIPSSPLVKGNAIRSISSKSGKYSLRLEYNILALKEENRAYIDLSSSNLEFKIPPTSIRLWVNSYAYSPGTLGMNLKTQSGEEIEIKLAEGITWIGWDYIESKLPEDLKLYPLILNNIYFEIPYNRDDYGVLLLDKLEAFYPENNNIIDSKNEEINDFYVVKLGDDLSKISKEKYGSTFYKNEIMQLNDIKPGEALKVGKVLVLRRH